MGIKKNMYSMIVLGILGTNMIGNGLVSAYSVDTMSDQQKIQEVKDLGILKVIDNNKATYLKVIKGFMNLKQVTDGRLGLFQTPNKIIGNPDVDNYIYTSNLLFDTNITKDNFAKPVNTGELLNLIKKYFDIDYMDKIGPAKNYYTNKELAVMIDNLYYILENNKEIKIHKEDRNSINTSKEISTNNTNNRTETNIVNNKIEEGKVGNIAGYGLGGKIEDTDVSVKSVKNTIKKVDEIENKIDTIKGQNTKQVVNMNVVGDQEVNGDLKVKGKLYVNGKEIDPNNIGKTVVTNSASDSASIDLSGIRSDISYLKSRINGISSRMHKVINPIAGDIAILTETGEMKDGLLNFNDFVRTTGSLDQDITGDKTFKDNVTIDGNLIVKGTKTEVNTQSMTVTDKTITLNKNGTTATADGAGLVVEGDNGSTVASLTYDKTNNRWNDGTDNLARKSEIDNLQNTKADKVEDATNGNFAGLDSNGNLTDSGVKDSDLVHVTGDESISGVKTFTGGITVERSGNSSINFANDLGQISIGSANDNKRVFIYDKEQDKDLVRFYNDGNTKFNNYGDIYQGGIGSSAAIENRKGSQLRGTYLAPPLYGDRDVNDNSTFYNVGDILLYGIDKGILQVVIKDKDGNDITPSNIANVFRDKGDITISNISGIQPITIEISRIDGGDIGSLRELILLYGWRDNYIKNGKLEVEHDNDKDGTYVWKTTYNFTNEPRLSSQVLPIGYWKVKAIKLTITEVGSNNNLELRNIIGINMTDNTNSYWLSRDGGSIYGDFKVDYGNNNLIGIHEKITTTNYGGKTFKAYIAGTRDSDNSDSWFIGGQGDGNDLGLRARSDIRFIGDETLNVIFKQGGNVGIGTDNPAEKLEVNGNIRITDPDTDNSIDDGDDCDNVGTITYDTGNDSFYGCIDNDGSPIWKQLNNN